MTDTTEPLKPGTIQFVTDGPPAHKSGRFVELEDHTGASIGIGRWEDRGDGLWALIVEPDEASAARHDMVQAVRSLAFEQRTANLIAYVRHIDDTDPAVLGQIFPRLGLDDPR